MATSQNRRIARVRLALTTSDFIPKPKGVTTTRARRCFVLIGHASGVPFKCGDRALKAGRCEAHYADWKNARESRRGTEAVNPARRAKKASGLSGRQWVRARKAARAAEALA